MNKKKGLIFFAAVIFLFIISISTVAYMYSLSKTSVKGIFIKNKITISSITPTNKPNPTVTQSAKPRISTYKKSISPPNPATNLINNNSTTSVPTSTTQPTPTLALNSAKKPMPTNQQSESIPKISITPPFRPSSPATKPAIPIQP